MKQTAEYPVPTLPAERLEVLEKAVRHVFATSDFHNANMRALAKEAQMGFNTVYKHFGDKEGLLFYFVRQWQEEIRDRISEHIQGLSDPSEKLRKIQWVFLDYLEKNADVGKIIYLILPMTTWMRNETFDQKSLTAIILNTIKEAQATGHIRSDVSAIDILDLMIGYIRRVFTMWIYRGTKPGLASRHDNMFDLFLSGVRSKA